MTDFEKQVERRLLEWFVTQAIEKGVLRQIDVANYIDEYGDIDFEGQALFVLVEQ